MVERNSLVLEDSERTEAILLGSLLLHPEVGLTVRSILRAEDFSAQQHRLIYEAILTAIDASPSDAVNAIAELLTERELEDLGGVTFLVALKQHAASTGEDIEGQVRLLRRRSLIRQFNEALEKARNFDALGDNIGQTVRLFRLI